MAYTDPTRSHANNPEWVRLCREVIKEAKKVTALGGGKIRFVTFAEKPRKEEDDDI